MKNLTRTEKRMVAAESTLLLTMLIVGVWLAGSNQDRTFTLILIAPFMIYGALFILFDHYNNAN